jgi:hypothetical protein
MRTEAGQDLWGLEAGNQGLPGCAIANYCQLPSFMTDRGEVSEW